MGESTGYALSGTTHPLWAQTTVTFSSAWQPPQLLILLQAIYQCTNTCGCKKSKQGMVYNQLQVWLKTHQRIQPKHEKSEQNELLSYNPLEIFIQGGERGRSEWELFNALQSVSTTMMLTVIHNNGLDKSRWVGLAVTQCPRCPTWFINANRTVTHSWAECTVRQMNCWKL